MPNRQAENTQSNDISGCPRELDLNVNRLRPPAYKIELRKINR